MLAASLGRNIDDGTFQQLQQALLYTFPADVTGNGRIVSFAGNFVDFINKDNSPFCFFHIIIRSLKQTCQDAFDIFPHISGLGKNRCIYDSKWNMEQFRYGTRQQRLTGTGASHHDNI